MNRDETTRAESSGLTRRRALQIGAGVVLAGAVGSLAKAIPAGAQETVSPLVKPTPPELFINLGLNHESRPENYKGLFVPNSMFFVRNHSATPRIDVKTYRLRVEGSSVQRPVELTYDDILRLPFKNVFTWIECAGNGRSFFGTYLGKPATGTQWRLGAIGAAEWTGVPLSLVLDMAGVKSDAVDVLTEGLDELKVRRPMPITKALDPNTVLAYAMNGEVLPQDHGFPIRAITPGWVGINNTKWLGRIQVENQKILVPMNTTSYIMEGPDYADKPALTLQAMKSSVALPWDGAIPAGKQLIRGFAWSPYGKIVRVEYSIDGENWRTATVEESRDPLLWQRWYFSWEGKPGRHYVAARASDEKGNVQPVELPKFNQQGYLFNTVISHPFYVEG